MSAGREMDMYSDGRQNEENIGDGVVAGMRKEENFLAFFRYVCSWFRRKGSVQEPPSTFCRVVLLPTNPCIP